MRGLIVASGRHAAVVPTRPCAQVVSVQEEADHKQARQREYHHGKEERDHLSSSQIGELTPRDSDLNRDYKPQYPRDPITPTSPSAVLFRCGISRHSRHSIANQLASVKRTGKK